MNTAQHNIKMVVTAYKTAYMQEYKMVCDAVAMKRKMTKDDFASVDGSPDMRGLFEISETLTALLAQNLTTEQMEWFKTKNGSRWFAKTYPEFSLPRYV